MVEEKESQEEEQPRKKRIPAIVMVLVGAALGGAGVVLFIPKHEPEPDRAEVVSETPIPWQPADVEMEFRFNPQTQRGKAFGQVSFTISFLVQPGKLDEAKDSVATRLNQARSRCLELLSSQSVLQLSSVDGKKHLKRLLKDELTYSLFPGFKSDRIAVVDDIFWTSFLIQ